MKLNKNIIKIADFITYYFKKVKKIDIYSVFHSPYLYLTLGLVIGFIFTTQFKTGYKRPLSPVLFYNQIIDIKEDFSDEKEKLDEEIGVLQKEINEKEKSLSEKNLVSNTLMNELQEQELVFGSTPVIN